MSGPERFGEIDLITTPVPQTETFGITGYKGVMVGAAIPQICDHCEKPLAGEDGTIDAVVKSTGEVEVVCRNCGEVVTRTRET